jgi:hypothetical protein
MTSIINEVKNNEHNVHRRKRQKTLTYNEFFIKNKCKEVYSKIQILLKKFSKNLEKKDREIKITNILIKSYSIDTLFNFISYFGMEILPNKIKYSIGYKFDSCLFMIMRNLNKYINKKERNLEKTDELYGNTLLLIAASYWDPYRVRDLLKEGYDIFKINKNGDSILHIVCRGYFTDVAETLIHELEKSSYDNYKTKSNLNNIYNRIINFINLKNKDNETCLVFKSNIYNSRLGEKFERLEKNMKENLNSENLLIKCIVTDLNIVLPKNIYIKKRYQNYRINFNRNLNELVNMKFKLFFDALKIYLDKYAIFDINKEPESGWGDLRGWILDKYDIRSQISRRDLEELSNFVMKSYKKNKFKLYYLDENNKKIIFRNNDNFSKLLNNTILKRNNILINELFLEFDNDKFKNKDPIFGIKKSSLDNILSKISNPLAINVTPIQVIKLHQKQLTDNFIKNNDKKNLITLFIRDFVNITYTDYHIFDHNSLKELNLKCKIDDIINLIDDLNNKIKSEHWIFEFNVNRDKSTYINSSITTKFKDYLKKNNIRKSPRIKNYIENILGIYIKYQYYGLMAEFMNTWGCNFYFIKDYKNSRYLFEISNILIKDYFENLFVEPLNNKYIHDNFKECINERKNKWNSKKYIFEKNLKNSIENC